MVLNNVFRKMTLTFVVTFSTHCELWYMPFENEHCIKGQIISHFKPIDPVDLVSPTEL